ncbi:BC1872 family protein [Bacillus benzoevorans]|uniref:Phage ABA sandwich domain-containing protein n=1 Tax=Bacillus benzoevorans TaxID=1456 RepID=A0A7X0LUA4_9BACI|nr:hypothetical protein [Bacillus benzoevorans]MBB6444328.1 hypothetical protein [Bacillus benzoevorans]
MNKTNSIAREILGWKEVSKGSWYDSDNQLFINEAYFKPEKFIEHAMVIVKKLEKSGYSYQTDGCSEVSFNNINGTGNTLPEAIVNGAYSLVENYSIREWTNQTRIL